MTVKMVVPMFGKRESMRTLVSMDKLGKKDGRLCHKRSARDEHVILRLGQNVFGRATEQQYIKDDFSMLAERDQIAVGFPLQDALRNIAGDDQLANPALLDAGLA